MPNPPPTPTPPIPAPAPITPIAPEPGGTLPVDRPGPGGHVLTVGAGCEFVTISDAIAACHDNDVIAVRAGTYVDAQTDTETNTIYAKNVTIEGVGGMVHLVAGPQGIVNGKALIVAENGLTLKNFELSGATDGNPDDNLAGVRCEGGNLTLENDYIHDNQAGVLGGGIGQGAATYSIDHCEIADNGSGSGYTHNIYTGTLASLSITNSYIHGAVVGHEIKSRAAVTTIENNIIADGPDGTASYCIDLPNAGVGIISGNIIEKGPLASNAGIIHYGGETQYAWATNSLTVTDNTILNDLGASAGVIWNQSAINGLNVTAILSDNQFWNVGPGNIGTGPIDASGNVDLASEPVYSTASPLAGAPTIRAPGGALRLLLTNGGHVVTGGAEALTVIDLFGGNVIASGTVAGITVFERGGPSLIETSAGTANAITMAAVGGTLDSAGADTIEVTGLYTSVVASGASTIACSVFASFVLDGVETLDAASPANVTVGAGADATVLATGSFLAVTKLAGGTLSLLDSISVAAPCADIVSGGAVAAFAAAGQISLTATDAAAVTLLVGAGATRFSAGAGADTLVFSAGTVSDVVIEGYKLGIDQLVFDGFSGNAVASGTVTEAGTLLSLTDGTQIQIDGVALPQYVNQHHRVSGEVTLSTSGNVVLGNGRPLGVTDTAGGNVIRAGAGGLVAEISGTGDTITTTAGARDTIGIAFGSRVTSAGSDTIAVSGRGNGIAASGVAQVRLGFYGNTVTGGAGLLTVVDIQGGNGIAGGTGGLVLSAGSGDAVSTLAGAADSIALVGYATLASAGKDRITLAGNYNAVTASGASTLTAAAGSFDSYVLNGGETLVDAGGGTVTVGSAGQVTIAASGADVAITKQAGGVVSLTQQTATGPASATVGGGAASLTGGVAAGIRIATGAGGAVTVALGGGAAWVTSLGDDTITGGAGTCAITAAGVLGTTVTFLGGGGGASLVAGAGTLDATGGGGAMAVQFGGGAARIAVGAGAEVFTFAAGSGGGTDVIAGYRPGVDGVRFAGVAVASSATAGGNLALVLTDGTHATFLGVGHL